MGWFVLITSFAGLIIYRAALIYYLHKNRRALAPDFYQQLRQFRIIKPLALAMPAAGIVTLVILSMVNLSQLASLAVWTGLYMLSALVLSEVAKRTIKEWFVPFSSGPGRSGASSPRSAGRIIMLVILLALLTFIRFSRMYMLY